MKRVAGILVVAIGAFTLGCQTPQKPVPPPSPAAQTRFDPAWHVSAIQRAEGQYADLFGGGCRAIWVDPNVAAYKKEAAGADTALAEPGIDADAIAVANAYVVIECQLESQFADMSIAYDVVRLRGIEVYIELPDGTKIYPIQSRPFGRVEESPVGAIRRFSRTTVVIFPRDNLVHGLPAIGANAPAVKLVLEGFGSRFFFEWAGIPPGQTGPRMPTAEEAGYMARLGYYELFTSIRRLAHVFD